MSESLRSAMEEAYRAIEHAIRTTSKGSTEYIRAIREYQRLVDAAVKAGGA